MSNHPARESLELSLMALMEAVSGYGDAWPVEQLQNYAQNIKLLKALAEQDKLEGLTYIASLLERCIDRKIGINGHASSDDCAVLGMWPALVLMELLPAEVSPDPADQACTWQMLHQLRDIGDFETLTPEAVAHIESLLTVDVLCLQAEQPATSAATPVIAQVASEELLMLGDALAELGIDIMPLLLQAPDGDALQDALVQFDEHISNLLSAATHLGLSGLEKILQNLIVNLALLQGSMQLLTPELRQCLGRSVQWLKAYCAAPAVPQPAQQLAHLMADAAWPHAADLALTHDWARELQAVEIVDARMSELQHSEARAEDVDLTVPGDIEGNVLNSLLDELPLHAQSFSQAIQRLGRGGTLDDLEEARRIAHTLKGAGNTAGIKGIGNLTHVIEDVLLAFGRVEQLPAHSVYDSLVEAADCLEEMSESLIAGGVAPQQTLSVYQQMIDWMKHINADGVESLIQVAQVHAVSDAVSDAAPDVVATLPMALPESLLSAAQDVQETHDSASQALAEEAYLRVPVSLIESLLQLVDEDAVITGQMQERVNRLNQELLIQRASARQFRQLSSELEQLVDVRGLSMLGGGSHGLDALEMDQYNELHILTRKIVEASADGREFIQTIDRDINGLRDLVADKDRLLAKTQSGIQRTRMVAVTSVVPRLQRAVRQAARVLDRNVTLQVQGESTLIDAQLLNDLLDALMHLLRNAVDHGIEPSQERLAARKPAHGTIELSFAAIGSHISIACSDDGRGFDLDNIRRKAIHANLIAEDAQLTAEQTMRLILHSGFSTREQTTHISGRGLGMSIVNQAVLALRGSLEIGTSAAGGSSFNMRLPVQMSAKHVMLSRSSTQRIALSERGLEQLLPADRSRFERTEQGPVYLLGEDRLPVLRLDQLLGMPLHAMLGTTELETVMIVTNAQRTRSAVIGPELSESRRVIVKPLGGFVPPQAGIDGLAMLGDGSICSVVDLPDLIASYVAAGAPQPQISAAPDIKALPLCMVVDDSVSVRRTMEQLMQDAGYQVITARDGLDALSLLDRCTPDIALVDLEMPRMNGLDLTKSMRNRPLTKDTPVVMITSRFTDKHRALATEAGVNEFLTKPYTEDVLLGLVGKLLQPVFTAHSA